MSEMRRNWARCASIVGLLALASCATTGGPGHRGTTPRADLEPFLQSGASYSSLRAQVGAPHESFAFEFGTETGEPWDAWVAVYWGPPDPEFTRVPHPTKHRLVFALDEGDTLLDHWVLATESVEP